MNIHKLYIFSKNRDAIATQKGFAYQQLKTLEDWIENRINNRSNIIYCEFEDDIFSRDIESSISKFTQIKLYSTDFSFSSEAIKTAIAHFFMLYVKGDYAFDQIEFYFETNASIVGRDVKGNDADLLRQWYNEQNNISDKLLTAIALRVKKILDEYIQETKNNLKENSEIKSEVQIAENIYARIADV
jgi:hypothetical protein